MVLITGYRGFIGSYLSKSFETNGYDLLKVSLRETPIESIPFNDVNVVLHLSGLAHQKKTITYSEYERINTLQSYNLAIKSKKENVKHFIYFSTIKVYGNSGSSGISENDYCKPVSSYGKSKLIAEEMISSLEDKDFVVTVIRLPLVYGEKLKGNLKLLSNLIKVCPLLPFSKIENKRMMISLANLSMVTMQVIENRIFGILVPSDRETLSTTELILLMSKALGKKVFLFELSPICRKLIMIISNNLYSKLFESYYISNSSTMNKINTTDFISVYDEINNI